MASTFLFSEVIFLVTKDTYGLLRVKTYLRSVFVHELVCSILNEKKNRKDYISVSSTLKRSCYIFLPLSFDVLN